LNFDVVFLSELLSALSSEQTTEWQNGYQSHNCFAKIDGNNIPLALQYTSAVNVFLSELKIKDHIHDENNLLWKGAKLTYHRPFKKASKNLSQFGLPLEKIEQLFNSQFSLEKEILNIKEYAYPTSKITSLIFKNGGSLIQKDENLLEKIGFHFGQLAYILDALDDYEKDTKSNAFNGIKNSYQLNDSILSPSITEKVNEIIFSIQEKIISFIKLLGLKEEIKYKFISRLSLNIHKKIYFQKESIEEYQPTWKESKTKAEAIIRNIKNPIKKHVQYASLSLVVYINPETLDSFKDIDFNHLSVTATIATLFSALACFAGKKKKRWMRRFRKFSRRKRCIECDICSSSCCGSCDCSPCIESCGDGCCEICIDSDCCNGSQNDGECNKFWKTMLWILIAVIIIGMIVTLVVVA